MKFRMLLLLLLTTATTAAAQDYSRKDSLMGFLYPERQYDVHFYELSIEVNPLDSTVAGSVLMAFTAERDLPVLQFDLYENMEVERVLYQDQQLKYTREHNAVFVELPKPLQKGEKEELMIYYQGHPVIAAQAPWDGGFVWKKDQNGKPWIGMAVQGDGASLFWPNKDHITDEPDSMLIHCTVPDGLSCVANGKLIGTESTRDIKSNGYDKWSKWTWKVSNPINNYNVSLNIADYFHFSDKYESKVDGEILDLDYYVLRHNEQKAREQFQEVKTMLDCFENRLGKYPFYEDGYKLVETPYLGMEHQSNIAYGNQYLPGYLGYDASGTGSDYIIIHESGHEWFGNSITAEDFAELWIHEGFTTFMDAIYIECIAGYDAYVNYMQTQRPNIANKYPVIGPRDVYFNGWDNDNDMYYKGAWLMHTVRHVMNNDERFFEVLYDFAQEYRHSIVSTEEVIGFWTEGAGMDLAPIFRQYLYRAAAPVLEYHTYKKRGQTVLKYRWKTEEEGFAMPIRVECGDGCSERIVPETEWKETTFGNVDPEEIQPNTALFYFMTERAE